MSFVLIAVASIVAVVGASFFRRMLVATAVIAVVVVAIGVHAATNDSAMAVAALTLPTIAWLLVETIRDTFRGLRVRDAPHVAAREQRRSRSRRSRGVGGRVAQTP
jgi:hypothetical protein